MTRTRATREQAVDGDGGGLRRLGRVAAAAGEAAAGASSEADLTAKAPDSHNYQDDISMDERTYGQMIHDALDFLQPQDLEEYARGMRHISAVAMLAVRSEWGKDLSFGDAIAALKAGLRVARAGWNGKGMWIAYTPGSEFAPEFAKPGHAAAFRAEEAPNEPVRLGAHIDMRAADGSMVIGWLASQTDMLADDWCVVGG